MVMSIIWKNSFFVHLNIHNMDWFISYWWFDCCWWHTACSCCSISTGRLHSFVMFIFEVLLCWLFVHVSKYTHFKFQIFFTLNSGSLLGLCWAVQVHSPSRHFLCDWWQNWASPLSLYMSLVCQDAQLFASVIKSHTHTHTHTHTHVCMHTSVLRYLPVCLPTYLPTHPPTYIHTFLPT